jgi:hypothetical protein
MTFTHRPTDAPEEKVERILLGVDLMLRQPTRKNAPASLLLHDGEVSLVLLAGHVIHQVVDPVRRSAGRKRGRLNTRAVSTWLSWVEPAHLSL